MYVKKGKRADDTVCHCCIPFVTIGSHSMPFKLILINPFNFCVYFILNCTEFVFKGCRNDADKENTNQLKNNSPRGIEFHNVANKFNMSQ